MIVEQQSYNNKHKKVKSCKKAVVFQQQSCNNMSREKSFRSHNSTQCLLNSNRVQHCGLFVNDVTIIRPLTTSSSPSPCTIVADRRPSSSSCHYPTNNNFTVAIPSFGRRRLHLRRHRHAIIQPTTTTNGISVTAATASTNFTQEGTHSCASCASLL